MGGGQLVSEPFMVDVPPSRRSGNAFPGSKAKSEQLFPEWKRAGAVHVGPGWQGAVGGAGSLPGSWAT